MKRVLVITNNLKQASYRLRIAALVEPMAARGVQWDVRVRPRELQARRQLLRGSGDYDAVVLQRKLLDAWDAWLLRRSARRVFFDVDDAVMYHATAVGLWSRWRTRLRFRATLRAVDHVVAGSQYLAQMFQRRGRPVTVVPTVVDPDHYLIKTHEPADSPRLVWIGSRSTLPYLRQFMPSIERAARHVPGLRLLTIADASLLSAVFPVEHAAWSAQSEAQMLCRGDIGLAPTPVNRWTLGKCGFKIVQYMASGLPVVASPVGANAQIVDHGRTGFLAETPEQWESAIAQLANDVNLRRQMGQAARQRVLEHYSLDRAANAWAQLLGG